MSSEEAVEAALVDWVCTCLLNILAKFARNQVQALANIPCLGQPVSNQEEGYYYH